MSPGVQIFVHLSAPVSMVRGRVPGLFADDLMNMPAMILAGQ